MRSPRTGSHRSARTSTPSSASSQAVVDVPHALALSSGTAALHLALVVLGIGAGDEVVCSSLTFAATANAIRYTGASPVFVDCDARQLDDGSRLARRRDHGSSPQGARVRAVLAVDLYGQCCRLRRPDRGLRAPRRPARPGRRRVARRHLPGAAGRRPGPARGVLLQRQQDHHHERRRHAGLRRPGPDRRTRASSRRRRATPRRTTSTPSSASTTGSATCSPLSAEPSSRRCRRSRGRAASAEQPLPRASRGRARSLASCRRRATGRAITG